MAEVEGRAAAAAGAPGRDRGARREAAPGSGLLVVTPATVRRPDALAPGAVPKPLLRHGFAIAPRGAPGRAHLRLLFEKPLARYLAILMPFPVAAIVWPDLALPISQAPLLMLVIVLFLETSVLSIGSPERRRALADDTERARVLDFLAARGRAALTRIAARRDLRSGVLHLVIEQSAMTRVRPFTLVSLQSQEAGLLDLDPAEAALLRTALFDAALPEERLHRVNTATDTYLRAVPLDARSISAHARLAALAEISGRD